MHRDLNDDKPFVCKVADCGMRFTNEDHLTVHSKKHEMSLALNAGGQSSNSPAHHFLDQTPTPTKFLKNCDEISLFQELTQNPFDHAYKKALDNDPPLPGPQTGELNTPTLILSDSLKSSNAALSLGIDRAKAGEALKPSPLAKTSLASRIVVDLSGKSVMVTQSAASSSVKHEAVRRPMVSQSSMLSEANSPVLGPGLGEETSSSHASGVLNSSHIPGHMDLSQHSTPNLASYSHHLASSSSTVESRVQPVQLQEVKREEMPNFLDSGGTFSDQQQQCTMQVLLQLPNGDTVPISIPATINKFQYLGSVQQPPQLPLQQAGPQQQQPPPLQAAPTKLGSTSNLSTTMALKQRLKAQLQNQLSPTAKAAEVSIATSNPLSISTSTALPGNMSGQVLVGSTSPIMMVDSPGSEMNLSDSSDYSVDSKRQKMSPETGDPEERRRKFLERNRAAAARCRQKRKHWISNLEKKADELQNTNCRLQSEVKLSTRGGGAAENTSAGPQGLSGHPATKASRSTPTYNSDRIQPGFPRAGPGGANSRRNFRTFTVSHISTRVSGWPQ
ncbi:unnamed protein product [Candidula unifasciata]|uniref:Cyclic AMP-dependent transcription factor ATF-7 n=1 Tax=Candidula unifasciata TaxID=100452 RepID=A0A8S3YLT4_9EUPU|nr:unnamed protein product [Candidula unifasciata]